MSHPKAWANGRAFVMSAKERERLKIFLRVKRGELQQKEAAALPVGLSPFAATGSALLPTRRSRLVNESGPVATTAQTQAPSQLARTTRALWRVSATGWLASMA